MSDTHGAATTDASQPIPLKKTGKQSGADRTSDVVMAFRPVQTRVSEGTSLLGERIGIQIQTSQQTLSFCGDAKNVGQAEESTLAQEFVSHGNRENASEMVVARAREAYLRQRGSCGIMGQGSQR